MIPLAEAEVQLRFLLVCLVSPAVTSVQPAIDIMRMEQKLQPVVAQLELKPSQPLRERDDDWFVMFEAFREEPVKFPAGIQRIQYFYVQEATFLHKFAGSELNT